MLLTYLTIRRRKYFCSLWPQEYVEERHRHRYEVNVKYVKELEEKGLRFVGHDTDNIRMEVGGFG